jgi:hypothetical protein
MKKLQGGKRIGAGAKHKYGEPTIIISFRIPQSKKQEVHKMVKSYLDQIALNNLPIKKESKKTDEYGC